MFAASTSDPLRPGQSMSPVTGGRQGHIRDAYGRGKGPRNEHREGQRRAWAGSLKLQSVKIWRLATEGGLKPSGSCGLKHLSAPVRMPLPPERCAETCEQRLACKGGVSPRYGCQLRTFVLACSSYRTMIIPIRSGWSGPAGDFPRLVDGNGGKISLSRGLMQNIVGFLRE